MKSGFISLNDINNTNCYENCSYYYYFNELKEYICTDNDTCPVNNNKLIKEKKKCIDKCSKDNIYIYEYNNICYKQCPNGTKESFFICYDIIIEEKYSKVKLLMMKVMKLIFHLMKIIMFLQFIMIY